MTGHILNPQSRHLARKWEAGNLQWTNTYRNHHGRFHILTGCLHCTWNIHFFQSLILPPCDRTNFLHFHQAAVYTRCVMTCTQLSFSVYLSFTYIWLSIWNIRKVKYCSQNIGSLLFLPWTSLKCSFKIDRGDTQFLEENSSFVVGYRNMFPSDHFHIMFPDQDSLPYSYPNVQPMCVYLSAVDSRLSFSHLLNQVK